MLTEKEAEIGIPGVLLLVGLMGMILTDIVKLSKETLEKLKPGAVGNELTEAKVALKYHS